VGGQRAGEAKGREGELGAEREEKRRDKKGKKSPDKKRERRGRTKEAVGCVRWVVAVVAAVVSCC
jgi:hypothetical protein